MPCFGGTWQPRGWWQRCGCLKLLQLPSVLVTMVCHSQPGSPWWRSGRAFQRQDDGGYWSGCMQPRYTGLYLLWVFVRFGLPSLGEQEVQRLVDGVWVVSGKSVVSVGVTSCDRLLSASWCVIDFHMAMLCSGQHARWGPRNVFGGCGYLWIFPGVLGLFLLLAFLGMFLTWLLMGVGPLWLVFGFGIG